MFIACTLIVITRWKMMRFVCLIKERRGYNNDLRFKEIVLLRNEIDCYGCGKFDKNNGSVIAFLKAKGNLWFLEDCDYLFSIVPYFS